MPTSGGIGRAGRKRPADADPPTGAGVRRAEDRRVAEVYRDTLTDLARRVVTIAVGIGLPAIVAMVVTRSDTDPAVRWAYPPLLGYLLVYAWVLLRRPRYVVPFSRTTLVVFEAVWVVGMAVVLHRATDAAEAWRSLFPTFFMGLVVFLVVAFLFFPTRAALVNAGGVVVAVAVGALAGTAGSAGTGDALVDMLRYDVFLAVVALLLQVLSRAKSRLAVALAAVQRATDEALQMRDMAYLDPLTGLANRRRLLEELSFRSEHVSVARPVSVLYFDLDHFKDVNDSHGHARGDEVLQVVAQTTQRVVRSEDLVARLGGEEFVVVTPGTEEEQAVALAERLRELIPAEVEESAGLRVTASFGVTALRSGEAPSDVLARVDARMYVAKRDGRDRVAPLG